MKLLPKSQGIGLLEQLLAISVILTILSFGLHRYFLYQREVETSEVKSDVHRLFFALDNYFYITDCSALGVFPSQLQHPGIKTDLKLLDLNRGRPPILKSYQVSIEEFQKRSIDNKPLYRFIINALPQKLTLQQTHTLAYQTGGSFNPKKKQFTWQTLPTRGISYQSTEFKRKHTKPNARMAHFNCAQ